MVIKDNEWSVPLIYLSNSQITLEMPPINSEISLILNWSANCVTSALTGGLTFVIIDTKLYVPVVTLSTQENARLLQELNQDLSKQLVRINISHKGRH